MDSSNQMGARECQLGCEGIVQMLDSPYHSGRLPHRFVKVKNPNAPAVKREAEEDWR
jgi:ATP-dependent DNA ligase